MGIRGKPLNRTIQGPRLKHWSLQNESQCVIAEMPDTPLICLDFWCRAGSTIESAGEEGLAHFLEHMVFKGSTRLNEGEFDRRIETLGGSSNAATGFDDVHFHVLVPPKTIKPALELLLNLALEPTLSPESYSIEREVVLEEIAQYKDQPDEDIFQKLLQNCWKSHPYGRPILGFESSLKASTPKQMRAFHKRHYQAKNCCLSIAGPIPNKLELIINESPLSNLTNCTEKGLLKDETQKLNFHKGRKEIKVNRLQSARILMAWPMKSANEQRMIMGADIGTSLLAEGRRSRLVQHLREDLQIVENIDMDLTILEEGSLILLEACCLEKYLARVETEISKVLKEVVTKEITIQEISRAKQLVRNSLCFSLESASQVAGLAGSQSLWGRHQGLLEPLKYIDYWTTDLLKENILQFLKPEKGFTLIALPNSKK